MPLHQLSVISLQFHNSQLERILTLIYIRYFDCLIYKGGAGGEGGVEEAPV